MVTSMFVYVYVVQWLVCSDCRCCINKYIFLVTLDSVWWSSVRVRVCVCFWKVVGLNPRNNKGLMLGPEVKPLT